MFSINDTVMYGHSGVCRIVDICSKKFSGKTQQYYVLCPVYDDKTTIYCPVDSDKVSIRKLLSLEDVHRLIQIMPEEATAWIENDQSRREAQLEVLKKGDHRELIKLIKTLYFKRREKIKEGKKFHAADEKAMAEAEKLLYQEFALVLDIKPDQVVPFITGELAAE